jgi:hypothetical protein
MTGFHVYNNRGSDLSEEPNNHRFFHESRQGLLRVFEIRGTNNGYFILEWAVPMFLTAKLGWGRNPNNSGSIRVLGGYLILFIKLPVLVFDRLFKTKRIASSNF